MLYRDQHNNPTTNKRKRISQKTKQHAANDISPKNLINRFHLWRIVQLKRAHKHAPERALGLSMRKMYATTNMAEMSSETKSRVISRATIVGEIDPSSPLLIGATPTAVSFISNFLFCGCWRVLVFLSF